MYFSYGQAEVSYLQSRDKRIAEVIAAIGHIYRPVDTDLFSAVVHHIIGQQISTKAQQSVWQKMIDGLGIVTADSLLAAGRGQLQGFGMTFRKTDYILAFAAEVRSGRLDLTALRTMSDEAVTDRLVRLKGIGIWTAEMILLFCLQRPDVFSFSDLAIMRGLRMIYHHSEMNRDRFERYRRRFSPCGSVASLYLWAVAGGAIPGMKDYAAERSKK